MFSKWKSRIRDEAFIEGRAFGEARGELKGFRKGLIEGQNLVYSQIAQQHVREMFNNLNLPVCIIKAFGDHL